MTLSDRVKDLRATLAAVRSGVPLEVVFAPRPDAERLNTTLGTSLDGLLAVPVTPDHTK